MTPLPAGQPDNSGDKPKLPFIQFNNRPLRYVVDDCLKAAKAANMPPTIFQNANRLVRVRSIEEDLYLEEMDVDSFRGFLERVATFAKVSYRDEERTVSYWPLPPDFVRDILALPGWPEDVFPPISGISRCPFFTAEGELVSVPGYHGKSKIWLHLAPDLAIDPVSPAPSAEELKSAKHWIVDELLGGFPFQADADKANAVAYVFSPFIREIIKGPIPMGLLEAPAAGTGKGLLANAMAMPSLGTPLETIPQRNNDEEWRKAITAKLIELPTFILFDNLTGTLRSAALEAVLTSDVWSDRKLGETMMLRMKNRTIWLATANNLQIAGDLFRRTVWIRLDAKMERPEDRKPSDFRHPQILKWAKENRGKLIWAALTIIQAWIARGKEPGTENMGSYESWTSTLGGILKVIDLTGFLTNLQRSRVNSDDDLLQLGNLFEAMEKKFQNEEVTVNQIFTLVAENDSILPFIMDAETDHGRKVKLGRYLAKHRDRVVGNYQLVSLLPDTRSGCLRYRLSQTTAQDLDKKAETSSTNQTVSPGTTAHSPPTPRRDPPGTGDYIPEPDANDTGDEHEVEPGDDLLVSFCHRWWRHLGTKETPDVNLTDPLVNDGLVTGNTAEERDRACRDLLSELAGNVIGIFRVEKARTFIDKAGNRHPG